VLPAVQPGRRQAYHLQGRFTSIFVKKSLTLFFKQIAARAFIEEKNYGLAASYCTSAEDWSGLGHIIDYVLEDYIAGECFFHSTTTPS
jgi:hypothetical protein